MDVFRVEGKGPLEGEIQVGGSKNAALPILAACLLTKEKGRKKSARNKHKDKVDNSAIKGGIPPNCCKQI